MLALQSCTDNLIYIEPDNETILTGNTYKAAFTENSSADQFFTLNSGSQILLNASGSLQLNNKILTYIDNQWKSENKFGWTEGMGKASITALYPVYSDSAYTKNNLYSNNTLEDVLYVKDEFPAGKDIHLQFKHLFSHLTLHLSEELQNNFQKIEITCPIIVSHIEPKSAGITFAHNEPHTTSITQVSSVGNYSFIIPPVENMTITIDIQTDGKKYTTQLQSKSFTSDQEYTYNLKTSEKTPGIVTAEDWIAFSQLINHKNIPEYNRKTLDDFGEMLDGVMTYRLLNDINFDKVACTKLEHIGINNKKMFEGVFDGQGHTISNLTPKSSDGTTGLFGYIASSSTVKNIHIKTSSTTLKQTPGSSLGTGLLAGVSYGNIINCSVEDGEIISTAQTTPSGGIVGDLRGGKIINCHALNIRLIGNSSTGGIAGYSYGKILNCFSANNNIKGKDNSGGISGKSNNGSSTIIANCYVYANTITTTGKKGLFFGVASNSTVTQCFYSPQFALIGDGISSTNNTVSQNTLYHSDFTDKTSIPIYQLLNQWIDETAPTLYPDYTFTRWTDDGENLPAVFVSEALKK